MVLKKERCGVHTGKSYKRRYHNAKEAPESEGLFKISSTSFTADSSLPLANNQFHHDVCYSLKKNRRWELQSILINTDELNSSMENKVVLLSESLLIPHQSKSNSSVCTKFYDTRFRKLRVSRKNQSNTQDDSDNEAVDASEDETTVSRTSHGFLNAGSLDHVVVSGNGTSRQERLIQRQQAHQRKRNSKERPNGARRGQQRRHDNSNTNRLPPMAADNQPLTDDVIKIKFYEPVPKTSPMYLTHTRIARYRERKPHQNERASLREQTNAAKDDVDVIAEADDTYCPIEHRSLPTDQGDHLQTMAVPFAHFICNEPRTKSVKKRVKHTVQRAVDSSSTFKDWKVFTDEPMETQLKQKRSGESDISEMEQSPDTQSTQNAVFNNHISPLPQLLLRVRAEETSPDKLAAVFGARYREGNCSPRKFMIEVLQENDCAGYLIFETLAASDDAVQLRLTVNMTSPTDNLPMPLDDTVHASVTDAVAAVMNSVCFRDGKSEDFVYASTLSNASMDEEILPLLRLAEVTRISELYKRHPEWSSAAQQASECGSVLAVAVSDSTCEICFDGEDGGQMSSISSCQHAFCTSCWRNHLLVSVRAGQQSLQCPAIGCEELVDCVSALSFLPWSVYGIRCSQQRNQVTDSRKYGLVRCCHRRCGRLIVVNDAQMVVDRHFVVRCECGMDTCPRCGSEGHWPASCSEASRYLLQLHRLKDDQRFPESFSVTTVEGKHCPKCHQFIEKNEGCNHMSCICGAQFCWRCLGTNAHWYNCQATPVTKESHEFIGTLFGLEPSTQRSKLYCLTLELRLLRHPFVLTKLRQLSSVIFQNLDSRRFTERNGKVKVFMDRYTQLQRLAEYAAVFLTQFSGRRRQFANYRPLKCCIEFLRNVLFSIYNEIISLKLRKLGNSAATMAMARAAYMVTERALTCGQEQSMGLRRLLFSN